jgi:hypothetical protein
MLERRPFYLAPGLAFWPQVTTGCAHGYWDNRLGSGQQPTFHEHYNQCFDTRARRGVSWVSNSTPYPYSAFEAGTVSTWYATFYRITSSQYLRLDESFPLNWQDDQRKLDKHERYSPKACVGHYFGLTLDAVVDEAIHYGKGHIDETENVLFTLECYFERILYLANSGVAEAVFRHLNIPFQNNFDCVLQLMYAETANAATDQIGLWAREVGYDGIIFPSARWGSRVDLEEVRREGKEPFPEVDHVKLGTPFDVVGPIDCGVRDYRVNRIGRERVCNIPAFQNLVLFSNTQLRGDDRAMFFQVAPISYAKYFRAEETRSGSFRNTFEVP